jgi:hypothetical protein
LLHQLLVYADTETLIGAGKEVGLEVNIEKTKYVLLSRQQNAGQNHYILVNIANSSINHSAKYAAQNGQHKYTTLTVNWHPDNKKEEKFILKKKLT